MGKKSIPNWITNGINSHRNSSDDCKTNHPYKYILIILRGSFQAFINPMNEIFYSLNHNFDSYFQKKDDVSIIMYKNYKFVKELLIYKYILGKKFIAFLYSFNLYQSSLIFNITRLIKLTNIYVNFKIGGIILKRGTFQLMKSVNKSIVRSEERRVGKECIC